MAVIALVGMMIISYIALGLTSPSVCKQSSLYFGIGH
jgi:hypothetical protein